MNRTIKFRVWNTKTNNWVDGCGKHKVSSMDGVNLFGETILLGGFMNGVGLEELNDCIPLQYTGLNDKNGAEIFEGDILCLHDNPPPYTEGNSIVKVVYHGTAFAYEDIDNGKINYICGDIGNAEKDDIGEIIDNIWENPELCA